MRSCRRTNPLRSPRQGLATLETVMVFPAIIALAAMLLAVGSASIKKAGTVVTARHAAWSLRSERPGTPFLKSAMEEGLVRDDASQVVSLPPGLAAAAGGSSRVTAVSWNHLHVNPWDDPKAGLSGGAPHLAPMFRMAASGLLGQLTIQQPELQQYVDKNNAGEGGGLEQFLMQAMDTGGDSPLSALGGEIAAAASSGNELTRRITGPIASAFFKEFEGFLGQAGGLDSVDMSQLRAAARVMNSVVVVAGETLRLAADIIDPSKVIDKLIDELPEPAKTLAKAANKGGGLLGDIIDGAMGLGDKVNTVLGGGSKESDEEKAGKKLAGLIKKINSMGKSIAGKIARPMRNLAEAAHGRDVKDDSDGAGFEKELGKLENTLDELESAIEKVEDILETLGVS